MIEERFEELICGLTRKVNFVHFPEDIFFCLGDECLFEFNLNSGHLWCSMDKVWKVLECEARYKYDDIKSFIKRQMEEHFKLMEVTPRYGLPHFYLFVNTL